MDANDVDLDGLMRFSGDVVSAYLSKNSVSSDTLIVLIKTVFASLRDLATHKTGDGEKLIQPAVSISRSITSQHLVCLEDGKKLTALKRHLKTAHKLSPESYRQKWRLPANYPMVAPSYSAERSAVAIKVGLGKRVKPDGSRGQPG